MSVVRHTDHHVKVLLSRVSPAIPELLKPTAERTAAAMKRLFPQKKDVWSTVEPLKLVVECVTEGIVYGLVGPGEWDSPELVRTLVQHTINGWYSPGLVRPHVKL